MDRVILHVDLNCFYASVEMVLDPSLRGKAVAVCGSTEDRHGIVLAKSELAKQAGVKTGMVTFEAKRLCPSLLVRPPRFDMYHLFSRYAARIYLRYTELVEPFGLDENWLDVTASMHKYESPFALAEEIREAVKRELGLTVSIGVSFNKVFAKLGSDLKKPDATSVITRENFREMVWPLPVGDLLYVGHATKRKLHLYGIHTIGQPAYADPDLLVTLLGKNGLLIYEFANGRDHARVMREDELQPIKSIGHGITCNADVTDDEEVYRIFLELSQDIARQLRKEGFFATGLQIAIKDKSLSVKQFDVLLPYRTQHAGDLAEEGYRLYKKKYKRELPIRALTIRATRLLSTAEGDQEDLFYTHKKRVKEEQLDSAVDDINPSFGFGTIQPCAILLNEKTRSIGAQQAFMPQPFAAVGIQEEIP